VTAPPSGPAAFPLTGRVLAASFAFLLWLEVGYAAMLAWAAGLAWPTALWQGALCVLAIPLLLSVVVRFVALPKLFPRLPKALLGVLWILGTFSEVVLPWLGWSTLLWRLSAGTWSDALAPGGGVAAFSYLTGVAILVLWGPRPRDVQVTEVEIPIPDLPPPFDGYRILHVSDLHASLYLSVSQLRARLAPAASLSADLIVFTGDLTGDRPLLDGAADALAALSAPDGLVAVLGNHDHWLGPELVQEALRARGLRPLLNAHFVLEHGGGKLVIAGVDNPAYADRDDLGAALDGVGEEEVVILLSHAPEIILRPLAARASLLLCGHTHGGQIALPLLGPLYVASKLGRRWAAGLHRLDRGWLYINRGLGEIFPPLRILCPPEIAVLTLRRVGSD
jgi:hypothetical protein